MHAPPIVIIILLTQVFAIKKKSFIIKTDDWASAFVTAPCYAIKKIEWCIALTFSQCRSGTRPPRPASSSVKGRMGAVVALILGHE